MTNSASDSSARIAARAAVVGALIGGLFGAVPSLVVAELQITSTTEQSQRDFIRSQRQSAYANIVVAHNEAIATVSQDDATLDPKTAANVTSKYRQAVSVAILVGSPEIVRVSGELENAIDNWGKNTVSGRTEKGEWYITATQNGWGGRYTGAPRQVELEEQLRNNPDQVVVIIGRINRDRVYALFDEFLPLARYDLSTEVP